MSWLTDSRAGSVALNASTDDGSVHSKLFALSQDQFVKRLSSLTIVVAEVNPQHGGVELLIDCSS
jgi:hypothetical protein